MSILETSYILFLLQPYSRNIGKRLTKTPKLYFHDTGLACYLLGLKSSRDVENSPLRGALFENLVVSDVLKRRYNAGLDNNLYFYRDKSQREVDLLLENGLSINAFEIKSAISVHKEFFKNLDYLKLLYGEDVTKTQVVYDGEQEWDKTDNGFVNYRHVTI